MIREIDIDEISDGKRYHANDMVKIECNDCRGCSECCHEMDDTIVLDPYDIYMLMKATGMNFEQLLSAGRISLRVVDGIIAPHILMQPNTKSCGFLSPEGRCTVHEFRPGFCRLFPMGRIYENDSFSYFLQVNECSYGTKNKIKLKKWLGIPSLGEYEKYILHYHNLLKSFMAKFSEDTSDEVIKSVNMLVLNTLFKEPYNADEDFYSQYYERTDKMNF